MTKFTLELNIRNILVMLTYTANSDPNNDNINDGISKIKNIIARQIVIFVTFKFLLFRILHVISRRKFSTTVNSD